MSSVIVVVEMSVVVSLLCVGSEGVVLAVRGCWSSGSMTAVAVLLLLLLLLLFLLLLLLLS